MSPPGEWLQGTEVALMREFGRSLGVTVRWRHFADRVALKTALGTGELDVAVGLWLPLGSKTAAAASRQPSIAYGPIYAKSRVVTAYKRGHHKPRSSAWAALSKQANRQTGKQANRQASQVAGTDPASRFVSLIAAAVSAKSANIAGINGEAPVRATALGWDHRGSGDHTYLFANGPTIGWIEADELYLEAETAMACAKRLAREQGNELPFSNGRIQKGLQEAGLLKSAEPDRNTVRKTLHVGRKYVLHLSAETVLGIEPPPNATPPKPVELNDEDLPF